MKDMAGHRKTVIFEKKYGANINKFATTEQVDDFIEDKLGRKLRVKKFDNNVVVRRGNVFPIKDYDICKMISKRLKR